MVSCVSLWMLMLAVFVTMTKSGNVVIFSQIGSHFRLASILAEELVTQGLNVTLVSPATCVSHLPHTYTHLTYAIDENQLQSSFSAFQRGLSTTKSESTLFPHVGRIVTEGLLNASRRILSQLRKTKFNVAVVDPAVVDALILVEALQVPHVMFSCSRFDIHLAHIYDKTVPLSIVPVGRLQHGYTHRMTFLERVLNFLNYSIHGLRVSKSRQNMKTLRYKRFPELPKVETDDLLKKSKLWVVVSDFSLEFPYPVIPNVKYVGSMTTAPPLPLPQDLENFVTSTGEHGVILFSMTTLFTNQNSDISQKFLQAFEQLPHGVLWKGDYVESNCSNIKAMEWFPQNDLLGHPQVKLLITNGGQNGIHEAMYHGVPMIVVPLFGDQPDNAIRVEARGYGIRLDVADLTTESILTALRQVLFNSAYKKRLRSVSEMLHFQHSDRSGRQKAAYWVEHAARFHQNYIESPANDMNIFQIYGLDVLLFLVGFVLVLVLVVFQMYKMSFWQFFYTKDVIEISQMDKVK